MTRVHDHNNTTTFLEGHPVIRHPSWCSPQLCFLDEDGVRVHEQESVCWEECEVRFESRLFFPDGEHPPTTYLQLSIENLLLPWFFVDTFLPVAAARRLRDQLTAHLDAAHSWPSAQAQTIQGDLTPRADEPPGDAFAGHLRDGLAVWGDGDL